MTSTTTPTVYNFDDISDQESPVIVMGGNKYRLKYPTIEDIEKIQSAKDDKEQEKLLYEFVTPEEGTTVSFEETLKKQDIRVLKRFSAMLKKEFGVEE